MKILVVDDNASLANSIERTLSVAGHEVVVAADGDQGLSMFRANSPDLVICDLVMPKEGGHFVIAEIRHEAPAIKIIAISGNSAVEGLAGALESGADEIIAKPFDSKTLLDTINTNRP
jgi:OmpR family response regulator RpaB